MKKRILGRIAASMCMAVILLANSVDAFAATTYLNPTADVSVGSDRKLNITAGQSKDLFSNMKGLMPGDVKSNTVAINNNSSQDLTFYLKAYPNYKAVDGDTHSAIRDGNKVTEGNKTFHDELLSLIGMKISMDGKVIFEGKADGTPELTSGDYGVLLGSVAAKTSKKLDVEITLPGAEMNNEFMNAFTAVDWVFIAEGKDSGGGGTDNGGDDNSGGGGNRPDRDGSTVEVVTINDDDVPLAAPGDGNGDNVSIEIVDGQVPLAALAKTGGGLFHLEQLSIMLLILGAGLVAATRIRKSYMK